MQKSTYRPERVVVPILGELCINVMKVVKEFSFDAAHKLVDRPETLCGQSIHGHTYTLDIEVFAALDEYAMVVDFLDLKPLIQDNLIKPYLDHHNLNETVEGTHPTAEYTINWIIGHIEELLPARLGVLLSRIRLYETPTGWAEITLLSDYDIAYVAGVFDGEGSISQSGGAELQMRITNTDLTVLQWIQSKIGGSIQSRGPGPLSLTAKDCFNLVVPSGRTRAISAVLLGYSRIPAKRQVLAVAAHFPRLSATAATDVQVQLIVDHLNSVSLINTPEKTPPHSVESWRAVKNKFRESRRASARQSNAKNTEIRRWMSAHPEVVEELRKKIS